MEFTSGEDGESKVYMRCNDCEQGNYYDSKKRNCYSCESNSEFGYACTSCTENGCKTCRAGNYLSAGKCRTCSSKYANCRKCNNFECLECDDGYEFFLGGIFGKKCNKKLFG